MGKIKITESQYKRIFNSRTHQIIKENVTDEECVEKLKKTGEYKVMKLTAYEAEQTTCESQPLIKCLLDKLKSLGVNEDQYIMKKMGSKCYVLLKSKTKVSHGSKQVNIYYLTFWGDGDIVLTISLQGKHGGDKEFIKVAYQGDWDCDNYTTMEYKNAVDTSGQNNGKEIFDIYKKDGTKLGIKSDGFLTLLGVGASGTIENLIKRINR